MSNFDRQNFNICPRLVAIRLDDSQLGHKKLDDWVVTKCSPYLTMTQTTTLPIFSPSWQNTLRFIQLTSYVWRSSRRTSIQWVQWRQFTQNENTPPCWRYE